MLIKMRRCKRKASLHECLYIYRTETHNFLGTTFVCTRKKKLPVYAFYLTRWDIVAVLLLVFSTLCVMPFTIWFEMCEVGAVQRNEANQQYPNKRVKESEHLSMRTAYARQTRTSNKSIITRWLLWLLWKLMKNDIKKLVPMRHCPNRATNYAYHNQNSSTRCSLFTHLPCSFALSHSSAICVLTHSNGFYANVQGILIIISIGSHANHLKLFFNTSYWDCHQFVQK